MPQRMPQRARVSTPVQLQGVLAIAARLCSRSTTLWIEATERPLRHLLKLRTLREAWHCLVVSSQSVGESGPAELART